MDFTAVEGKCQETECGPQPEKSGEAVTAGHGHVLGKQVDNGEI